MMDSQSTSVKSAHQSAPVIQAFIGELSAVLVDTNIVEAYSYSNQELIIRFENQKQLYVLKLIIQQRDLLLIVEEGHPAKESNARLLFQEIYHQPILSWKTVAEDRFLALEFSDDQWLCFKFYGSLSNVLLMRRGELVSMFRSTIHADVNWKLPSHQLIQISSNAKNNYNIHGNHRIGYRLLVDSNAVSEFEQYAGVSVIEALSKFARLTLSFRQFTELRDNVLRNIAKQIKKISAALSQSEQALIQLQTDQSLEENGHLIMANLHQIPDQSEFIEVEDFYHQGIRKIYMVKDKNAIESANWYYRKAKASKLEEQRLAGLIQSYSEKLVQLEKEKHEVSNATSIKTLKPYQKETIKRGVVHPYHLFERDGFEILVGKNAKANDELTFKIAGKFDIFLHASGVAGSHVIIKNPSNKEIPLPVKQYAAVLAAWYSKSRNSSLVPVACTPKKFVVKPRGATSGQVRLLQTDTLMACPADK